MVGSSHPPDRHLPRASGTLPSFAYGWASCEMDEHLGILEDTTYQLQDFIEISTWAGRHCSTTGLVPQIR